MIQITRPASRVFAAAALFGAMAFAQPTLAQTTAAPADQAQKPAASSKTVTPSHHTAHHKEGGVDAYLTKLHTQLKITAAQEPQWADYAKVMRDNNASFEALIKDRNANIDNMNAVDDVRSYAKLTEAHADAVKKLVPAFEALYGGMSDAQKKNADQVFAQAERRRAARHAKK